MNVICLQNVLVNILLAIFAFSISVNAFAADEAAAKSLLKKSKCFSCHSIDKKKDGPSYKKVAEKYRGDTEAKSKLIKHLTVPSLIEVDGYIEEHGIVKTRDSDKIMNLVEWILLL